MKKIILICLMLLFTAAFVNAAEYEIEKVAINGLFLEDGDKVALNLGSNTQVDVWVKGLGTEDIKVKAWIGGYEYGDLEDESEMFEVSDGVLYRKELYLNIPTDLRLNSNDYKLHIEVYDKEEYVSKEYDVFIEERIHDVAVQDVIMRPSSMIDAGRSLAVQVRLENFGQRKEQDVKVEVAIPQLGVYSVTWIDLLNEYGSDDSSESTNFIPLQIPKDAPTGDFQVKVTAYYSRLHETVEATRLLYIEGVDVVAEKEVESIILISSEKEHKVDELVEYKVAIANLASTKKSYTVEVTGLDGWALGVAEPSKLDVAAESGSESVVSLRPFLSGNHQFSIVVKEGNIVVKETLFNVNVDSKEGEEPIFKGKKNMVLIGMIAVLVVALIATLWQGMKPKD